MNICLKLMMMHDAFKCNKWSTAFFSNILSGKFWASSTFTKQKKQGPTRVIVVGIIGHPMSTRGQFASNGLDV